MKCLLSSCADADGRPVDADALLTDTLINNQSWGITLQMPGCAWPTLLLLQLPEEVQQRSPWWWR